MTLETLLILILHPNSMMIQSKFNNLFLIAYYDDFFSFFSVISFRQGNKLGIILFVTPTKAGVDCIIEFRMKHDYTYTVIPPTQERDKLQPTKETKWITHLVRVNLGKISN